MKKTFLFALLPLALLQACGGGSGGGGGFSGALPVVTPDKSTSGNADASTNSGSVSARFVPTDSPRYQLIGPQSQSYGKLEGAVQQDSGAFTKVGGVELSGNIAVKEIGGDANYAIGRWVTGTVTKSSGAETLTGTDNRAYHYIVYNAPAKLPTTGALTCDGGVFTTPTRVTGSTSAVNSAVAKGSVTLNFSDAGALVDGAINVSDGGASAAASLKGRATGQSTIVTGAHLSGGDGAALSIGAAGDGAYFVVAGYSATLTSGRHVGIARFRCA